MDRNSTTVTLGNIFLDVMYHVLHELVVRVICKYDLYMIGAARWRNRDDTHFPSSIQYCHQARKPASGAEFENSGIAI